MTAPARGSFGRWTWVEDPLADLYCADVVRALGQHFVGLRAVCTSWDSGMLDASGMVGWTVQNGQAVSPIIDRDLAETWPESSCGWDEWYFFDALPPFVKLHALCNWGVSIGEAAELEFVPSGFNMEKQIIQHEPRMVLGDGNRIFIVAQDAGLADEFMDLCLRRRTTRCS
jgi:hypothetical protein